MASPRPLIEEFFAGYEVGANTFDPDLVTSQFTEVFLACGPQGVFAGQNDDRFREVIPQRRDFMHGLGFQKAEILALDETILDDHCAMVAVQWRMTFARDRAEPKVAEFEILYLLFINGGQPRIAFFLSHDGEEQTMRDMGLLKE
jgi:hypothetical protein